jgi:hypothetical protein
MPAKGYMRVFQINRVKRGRFYYYYIQNPDREGVGGGGRGWEGGGGGGREGGREGRGRVGGGVAAGYGERPYGYSLGLASIYDCFLDRTRGGGPEYEIFLRNLRFAVLCEM